MNHSVEGVVKIFSLKSNKSLLHINTNEIRCELSRGKKIFTRENNRYFFQAGTVTNPTI